MLRRFVRNYVPEPAVLEPRLTTVFDFYCTAEYDGALLFTNKTWDVHQECMTHVRRGCLSDPANVPLYKVKKVLSNGLTIWQCVRGTSQLEGFHPYQVSPPCLNLESLA